MDDLFRVVQRQKSLGFVFAYVTLNVLTVHLIGGLLSIGSECGAPLPYLLLSGLKFHHSGLIICPLISGLIICPLKT